MTISNANQTLAAVNRWKYTSTGGETSLSGLDDNGNTLSYQLGTEQIHLNGLLLVRGVDYVATTGSSITGLIALIAGDVIDIVSTVSTVISGMVPLSTVTTQGDLIVATGAGAVTRLGVGTSGQYLGSNGTTTTWGTPTDATKIPLSTVTAKGDLIAATASGAVSNLAVGTNGQVLTAASGQTTGLQWATPVSGSMTLLSTTTLSTSSTAITGISQSYTNLYVSVYGVSLSATAQWYILVNGTSGVASASWQSKVGFTSGTNSDANRVYMVDNNGTQDLTNSVNAWAMLIANYTASTGKSININGSYISAAAQNGFWGSGIVMNASAVSSLTFSTTSGTFSAGTVKIYGVN